MTRIIDNPSKINKADIVVGIPSYNEAETIGYVVSMVDEGLERHFRGKDSVIINVDNHSLDGTKEAFMGTETKTPKIYLSTSKGIRGKGMNIRNLFEAGVELGAEAILMVDADLKSITPEWVRYMIEPIYLDYDYVIPIYLRHKYDGTITNNITYPLIRVLFGLRTRQPIAGEFAFSGRLARAYLTEKTWSEYVSEFGIDIWMTTLAIARRFKVCQSFLESAKIHRAKDPGADLGPMFTQVVGTIFQLAVDFEYLWKDSTESQPTPIFGFGLGVRDEPPAVEVDTAQLFSSFSDGLGKYRKAWSKVIAPMNLTDIKTLSKIPIQEIRIPGDLWARVLFDFIVAFRDELVDRQNLVQSLIPLYHLRTLSFVNKTRDMGMKESEDVLDTECRLMEAEKYYLITKWNQTPRRDGIPSIAQYLITD